MKSHLENPSGSKERFPCEIYNKPYKNKNGLKRHKKSEHLVNPSGSKERFTCEICNKTYKNNENPSGSKDRVPSEIRNKTYINKLDHTRHKKSVNVENPSGQISL